MQYPPPEAFTSALGDLTVLVRSGRNLLALHKTGSDPLVSIRLNNNEATKQKTSHKTKTVNPVWDESFSFRTNSKPSDTLVFHVQEHESLGKNKPLGEGAFPVGPMQPFVPLELSIPVMLNGTQHGDIVVVVNWHPHFNIPPPGELYSCNSGANLTVATPQGGAVAIASRPKQLPTTLHDATFAGVKYHLEGENVPVLTVELFGTQRVFFEHYIMLWKHTSINITVKAIEGAAKRLLAGLPIFLTEALGVGAIAFSRDGPGQIVPLHLGPGQIYHVREHQFLAVTGNVNYSFKRVAGVTNILFGGQGFFIDTFEAKHGEGVVWLHAYGNLFNKYLAPGEQIEVEPGGWVYTDPTVHMDVNIQNMSSGLFGSFQFITNKFTGPGNVGIQSMYLHMPTAV